MRSCAAATAGSLASCVETALTDLFSVSALLPFASQHGCYPTPPGEVPGEARKVGDMGNVIVGENGTGYYSERTNELIFLDVRNTFHAFAASWHG